MAIKAPFKFISFNMLGFWFFCNTLLWPININIGEFHLSLAIFLIIIVGSIWLVVRSNVSNYNIKIFLFILVILVFSFINSYFNLCEDGFKKSILSVIPFILMIIIGLEIGWSATVTEWLDLVYTAKWIIYIIFFEILFEKILLNSSPYISQGKYSGFYAEPSHLAVSIFPLLILLIISKRRSNKYFGIMSIILLLIFSPSTSLIALSIIFLIYYFLRSKYLILIGIIIFLIYLEFYSYLPILEPTSQRIQGILNVDNVPNISSLVYLQGWQDAYSNLIRTNGLGLGFNMMGCNPLPLVSAREILEIFEMSHLNSADGSFMVSKLISEFGVLGILLFTYFIYLWLTTYINLNRVNILSYNAVLEILNALLFISLVTFLLRGAGYFGPSFMIAVVLYAGINKHKYFYFRKNIF